MKRIGAVLLAAAVLAAGGCMVGSAQPGSRAVLFALQRSQRLHAFDAQTLQHLGYFLTGPLGDSAGAREDGRRLFLLQSMSGDQNSCCSLRTIDLSTREMCWMSDFAGPISTGPGIVASGDTVFNAQTLERIPVPRGFFTAYASKFSPDGRYTARIDRGPVLVFTDMTSRTQRSIPIPEEARAGDWFGNRFALVAADTAKGRLWAVSPTDSTLPEPRAVTWPDSHPTVTRTFAASSDLISYARFGRSLKQDPREKDPKVPGGALVIPSAGGPARRIARDIYFRDLIPGLDGRSLYGVEAGPLEGADPVPVRLVRLDVRTGAATTTFVIKDLKLFPSASFDVWSLAIANVPEKLVPRGETQLAACTRR